MFFFQAEDGIRDIGVTGVQTCALPILLDQGQRSVIGSPVCHPLRKGFRRQGIASHRRCNERRKVSFFHSRLSAVGLVPQRSEERRVGKECRYWWVAWNE